MPKHRKCQTTERFFRRIIHCEGMRESTPWHTAPHIRPCPQSRISVCPWSRPCPFLPEPPALCRLFRASFRVNVVRKSGVVLGTAAACFQDASLWEKTKKQGTEAVKRLIDRGLEGTMVTCVLIGQKTASRRYVTYEIQQSVKRGNGLLGTASRILKALPIFGAATWPLL
jgi:hypothetical protein